MRILLVAFVLFTLLPSHRQEEPLPPKGNCIPGAKPFPGYSFLLPEIININAAYAPFFTQWDDYYDRYFDKDHQREENIEEWRSRFCDIAKVEHVESVVYQVSINDLLVLRDLAFAKAEAEMLPYPFIENTFAEVLTYNGCIDAIDYLIFARHCEPYVTQQNSGWTRIERNWEQIQQLIEEGRERLLRTPSHFLRMRYAYQVIRLAHYAGKWQYTVDLYNELLPKIERRRPTAAYYWALGHLAGALQRLGKTAEAAYRYSLIFRHCPSKRIQAFRSFYLKDENDWNAALRLCRNDSERATLYLLRAAKSRVMSISDLETIYRLEPKSPHLEIILVGIVQQLERIFLYNAFTQRKRHASPPREPLDAAAKRLIDLQRAARRITREGKTLKPILWQAMAGYLEVLAGDSVAANKTFQVVKNQLTSEGYDKIIERQIEVWELLNVLLHLDGKSTTSDSVYFALKKKSLFQQIPSFEIFAQDYISAAYAANKHPGKAILVAFGPEGLLYNPQLEELDDLIRLAQADTSIFLSKYLPADTSMDQMLAFFLEAKGTYFLSRGQPEAALAVFEQIPTSQTLYLEQFTPFKEVLHEKIGRPTTDTLLLNRIEIAKKLVEYDQRAKAAMAMNDPSAAWYLYLMGLAYYNMSYFGHAWHAADFYRSGYNWNRLAQGPVFPLRDAPNGNRENTDVSLALYYFERALAEARNPELAARAAFMAARCQQKQWFCHPDCRYRPGSKMVPQLPEAYRGYYARLKRYEKTQFYAQIVEECRWLPYYQ